ncbi:MAG: guanine deaminase [Pseudomonadota bacterium]
MVTKGYRARIIHALDADDIQDIKDGLLIVGDDGKIISVGKWDAGFQGDVVDLKDRLIIPGLIDCHSHIPQLDCRGKHGATLLAWLKRFIFPAERSFSDLKVVDDVGKRFFKKLILNGTTTAALYSTVHYEATDRCFEIAKESGVRAIIGKVMMDQDTPPELQEKTSDSLNLSEKLCAKWHNAENGRLRYAFTPRFAPTCSIDLWKGIGKLLQDSGAYLQSHIAETLRENDKVKEFFPTFKDYFSLFEETSCATAKTILAHAIYLSDDEIKRMSKSEVKIAHCPTSNFFLKSGTMPAEKIEEARCIYGLGTDVGAGTSMSMFSEMRHADYIQHKFSVTPEKVFYLATLGGAHVLSMQDDVGNFKKGKCADFAVLNITGIDYHYRLKDLDTDEVLSLLMYRGHGGVIESTYVDGQKLDVDKLKLDRKHHEVWH